MVLKDFGVCVHRRNVASVLEGLKQQALNLLMLTAAKKKTDNFGEIICMTGENKVGKMSEMSLRTVPTTLLHMVFKVILNFQVTVNNIINPFNFSRAPSELTHIISCIM